MPAVPVREWSIKDYVMVLTLLATVVAGWVRLEFRMEAHESKPYHQGTWELVERRVSERIQLNKTQQDVKLERILTELQHLQNTVKDLQIDLKEMNRRNGAGNRKSNRPR